MKQIHKVLRYTHPWQVAMDADIQALDGWELVSCHKSIDCEAIYTIYRKSVTDKEYKKWREKVDKDLREYNRVYYDDGNEN